ncbi:MAG: galactose oxidase early set domain-containing protein [Armatimonadota bacterium]|nr:galactose oxidase early set domain-containing protein [Armatimonadota bacterium]
MKKIAVLTLLALSATMLGQALGTWSEINWPNGYYHRAIHLSLLPDERMILWNSSYSLGQPLPYTPRVTMVWPGTNHAYDVFNVGDAENTTTNLFCVGKTHLEDGRLFCIGGHKIENGYGDDRINVFDWRDPKNVWITGTEVMTQLRWYPTATYLPDRRILLTTGLGGPTHAPSYIPDLWIVDVPFVSSPLKDYHAALPEFTAIDAVYPFFFVDPKDGNLFLANRGRTDESPSPNKKFNLATLQWSNYGTLANQNMNVREQYPSPIFINAKNSLGEREAIVLMTGGSKNGEQPLATSSAIFANLYNDPPTWTAAQSMNITRQCHQLVALPTTDVIAFGGTDRFGLNGVPYLAEALTRATPELWNTFAADRTTRPWRLLATPTRLIPRGYHSTAVLMPDARVMTAGGEPEGGAAGTGYEWQKVPQIYSPPYGGRADWITRRPSLSAVPGVLRYGETFQVTMSPNATSGRPITRLIMCTPAASTHAFNGRQEMYELEFVHVSGNTYDVTPPAATKLATPGHYMVFAVDDTDDGPAGETRIKGIPSVCKWVQLKDFEQVLVTGGRIARGSSLNSIDWTKPFELLLGDNDYLGDALRYGPGFSFPTVEVEFEGDAVATTASKVRLRVQAKGSTLANMWVYLKKRTSGLWTLVDGPLSVVQSDKDFETVVDNDDYLGPNGEITAKIAFRQMSPGFSTPSIFVDLAEFGVR